MSYKIVVTPDAIKNIENAVNYYKFEVSDKVAKLFINDYQKTFKDIQKTKYFQYFFEDFRGKPMKKFPFIVFYTINEEIKVIFIKAVFHTSQNPGKYPLK
jgi:toxin ParE1/3/4